MAAPLQAMETMLAQGKDNAMLRVGLGLGYLKEKNLEKAIEHFAVALLYNQNYSAAWKGYAKALAENNQIEMAIDTYQKGIAIAQNNGDLQAVKEMQVFFKRLQAKTIT
jgi:Tfp pilus assembly protein PilF